MHSEIHNGRSLAEIVADLKEEAKEFVGTRIEMFRSELRERTAVLKVAAPLGAMGALLLTTAYLLFTLAIRNVRRPEVHRRLMLLAMLPILPPGIHRLYMVPLGLTYFPLLPMYLTLDAMALAILVHEWRGNGRIGVYTWLGVAWIVAQQLLHYPVTHAQWFAAWVYEVSGLVGYR